MPERDRMRALLTDLLTFGGLAVATLGVKLWLGTGPALTALGVALALLGLWSAAR